MRDKWIWSGVTFGAGLALAVAGNLLVRHRRDDKGLIASAVACGVGALLMGHAITTAVFLWPEKVAEELARA
jgi:hypothetical protein